MNRHPLTSFSTAVMQEVALMPTHFCCNDGSIPFM